MVTNLQQVRSQRDQAVKDVENLQREAINRENELARQGIVGANAKRDEKLKQITSNLDIRKREAKGLKETVSRLSRRKVKPLVPERLQPKKVEFQPRGQQRFLIREKGKFIGTQRAGESRQQFEQRVNQKKLNEAIDRASKGENVTNQELRNLGLNFEQINEIGKLQAEGIAFKKFQEELKKPNVQQQLFSAETPERLEQLRRLANLPPFLRNVVKIEQATPVTVGFTKQELDILSKAPNKQQALQVIKRLQRQSQKAEQQKLESFLSASVQKKLNKNQIDKLNESINKQIQRLSSSTFKNQKAKNQLKKELGRVAQSFINSEKPTFRGTTWNVYLGFFNTLRGFVKGLEAPYNYGKGLTIRALQSKKLSDYPIFKDIVKISRGIGSTVNFIKDNPKETLLLLGTASAITGKNYLTAFRKNPVATVTQSILEVGLVIPTSIRGFKWLGKLELKARKQIDSKVLSKLFSKKMDKDLANANVILYKTVPSWEIAETSAKFKAQLRQKIKFIKKIKNENIEKVVGKVLSKKEAEALEQRFFNKDLPKKDSDLIDEIDNLPALSKNEIIIAKRKITPRFQLTTVKTNNKGLFKLTVDKVTRLTVKKGLPKEPEKLISLLLKARKESGQAFSNLKKKIKRDLNLNVVERKTKDGLTFKLLEPKQQRKKGIKTAGKKEKTFLFTNGKVVDISKRKGKDIKEKENKISKSLKDIEFEEGQNLEKLSKSIVRIAREKESRGIFGDKKARSSFTNVYRKKFYNKSINKSKSDISQSKKRKGTYKSNINSLSNRYIQALQKARKSKNKSDIKQVKEIKKKIDLQKSKVLEDISELKKDVSLIKSQLIFLNTLSKTIPLFKQDLSSLSQQLFKLNNLLKNELSDLNKIKDIKTPKTSTKPSSKPPKQIIKPPGKPQLTKLPPPSKPPKQIIKPPGKPQLTKLPPPSKLIKIPRLSFNSKLKKGEVFTVIPFTTVKRKKVALTKTPIPFKRGIDKAIKETTIGKFPLSQSIGFVLVGKNKIKDTGKGSLINYRKKKSTDPRVLEFVPKKAIKTVQEKLALKRAKLKGKFKKKKGGKK